MANKSVLQQLRQRKETSEVPPRTDPLLETITAQVPDGSDLPEEQSKLNETGASIVEQQIAELQAQLEKLPATPRHGTINLDHSVSKSLTAYCKERGVTVETWLEATWVTLKTQSELLDSILEEAKRRYATRKEAGRLRKLITMLSKSKL